MVQENDWSARHRPILERLRFDEAHPELVRPSYDGHGITSLPWTVLDTLGVPVDGPPLAGELIPAELRRDVRVVLVIVVDALGYRQVTSAMQAGDAPGFAGLAEGPGRAFVPLSSTFPSTTAAALTALQTGAPPARHGLVGYWCYLREFGMLSNLIEFKPVGKFPSYSTSGVEARPFLPVPTIYERATAAGVAVEMVNFRPFRDSALSRMHAFEVPFHPYRTLGEFATAIRGAVAGPGKRLVVAYWPMIDLIGHSYGPRGETSIAELRLLDAALRRELLEQLEGDDLLMLLTADHGQTQLDPAKVLSLNGRPDLLARLRLPPAGERRAVYLYPSPGEETAVRETLEEIAGENGVVASGANLIAEGLYGPEPIYAEVPYRVGDLVLIARGPATFPYSAPGEAAVEMLGSHGSLDADDMLVPLFAWRGGTR